MGGACGMHDVGEEYIVLAGESYRSLEDLSIDGTIILEWFLNR
jgi:hypothetical protein